MSLVVRNIKRVDPDASRLRRDRVANVHEAKAQGPARLAHAADLPAGKDAGPAVPCVWPPATI